MEWLRIDTATIKGPEFIGATPVQRATWLCLLNYCVEQENGGVIDDCGGWGSRHWMQSCGVMLEEIEDECDLWSLEENIDDGSKYLVVAFYPIQDQEKCVKLRKRAKDAGLASAKARAKAKADGQANGQPKGSTEERREEERKGEEEDTSSTSNPPHPPSIDFFKGKDCYIGDDHNWFDGCYHKFTMDFLHMCIHKCSEARYKKNLKPMVCKSDLQIMIKHQYKTYGEDALRVEQIQKQGV